MKIQTISQIMAILVGITFIALVLLDPCSYQQKYCVSYENPGTKEKLSLCSTNKTYISELADSHSVTDGAKFNCSIESGCLSLK